MTRDRSPVFTLYPPDPAGRRPSERTILQYAGPNDRSSSSSASYVPEAVAGRGSGTTFTRSDAQYQQQYLIATSQATHVSNGSGHTSSVQHTVSGGGDYSSSEGSPGQHQRFRPPVVLTRQWYCCTSGCTFRGPYNYNLYENCALGCGHIRCPTCEQEVIRVRDREGPRS